MREKYLFAAISIACAGLMIFAAQSNPVVAKGKGKSKTKADGAQTFKTHCASCHTAGGNNVKPEHPLAGSKQLSTLAVFKSYLSKPPGHMPYYQDVVNNKEMLDSLYK